MATSIMVRVNTMTTLHRGLLRASALWAAVSSFDSIQAIEEFSWEEITEGNGTGKVKPFPGIVEVSEDEETISGHAKFVDGSEDVDRESKETSSTRNKNLHRDEDFDSEADELDRLDDESEEDGSRDKDGSLLFDDENM